MKDLVSIAKILNFHGIKGEAKVGFTKGKESQIEGLRQVIVDTGLKLTVQNVRFHKQFAIIKFKEINSIDELMEFKGKNLYIPHTEASENLGEDEFLIEDLIGMLVFDNTDELVGKVAGVSGGKGGDVLHVEPENAKESITDGVVTEQFLIPFVKELVPVVDVKKRKIIIKPIEGLLG